MQNKIKILILWSNNDYMRLRQVVENMLDNEQIYWFSIVCGGLKETERNDVSLGERLAKDLGCPIEYFFYNNPESIMRGLVYECDYLVMLITDRTPHWQKNLMMRMKGEGKHGIVIRN